MRRFGTERPYLYSGKLSLNHKVSSDVEATCLEVRNAMASDLSFWIRQGPTECNAAMRGKTSARWQLDVVGAHPEVSTPGDISTSQS